MTALIVLLQTLHIELLVGEMAAIVVGCFKKKEVNNGKVFQTNNLEIEDWLPELYRVLKPQSHCYIMTNNKNITHYLNAINNSKFHFIKCLIWVKDNKIMGQTYEPV